MKLSYEGIGQWAATFACDDLAEALDADLVAAAGGDGEAYTTALETLRTAADGWNQEIAAVNSRYQQALSEGASQEDLDAIRAEGRALNAKTLEAFRFVQDHFIGIASTSTILIKHQAYQENIALISGVVDALEQGVLGNEEGTGALDQLSKYQAQQEEFQTGLRELYLDKVREILSEADFLSLSRDFSKEKELIEGKIAEIGRRLEELDIRIAAGDNRRELVQRYANLEHLTREMVEALIDCILVGKRQPGESDPPVEIHWNF